ncbi:MAG: DUF3341 domain-containing protein [Planctomycetota bacterium]
MTVLDAPQTTPIDHALDSEAAAADDVKVFGIIGEFDNVTDVMAATQAAYDAGYRKMDVHSPFPIHGIDDALGVKQTILPWLVLCMGLCGMATGIFLTTYTMGTYQEPDIVPVTFEPYDYLISGKPFNAFAGYFPVIFELTIMFSAYTAVFAMFLLNKLPLLYHPLFNSKNFRRATQDRFFLAIESQDRNFDAQRTDAFLKEHKAMSTELIDE